MSIGGKPKHTAGPWVDDGVVIWAGEPSYDIPIAAVTSRSNGMDPCPFAPANGLENARLIASAPDMLEMLQEVARRLKQDTGHAVMPLWAESLLSEVERTIEKAEGRG